MQIEYSASAALARTFAFAQVYGAEKGIAEAQKLKLTENHLYHSLLAELYAQLGEIEIACIHLQNAIQRARTQQDRDLLRRKMEKLLEG